MAIWPGRGSSASISSPARTGTCVWGMSRRMAKGLGEVRRSRREVGFVGLPGRAVPELEAVAHAGDHDLAVDPGVLQELRRQHHAAGGIQLGLQGVPVQDAPQLAALAQYAGAQIGALYRIDDEAVLRVAAFGLEAEAPERFELGEGLVGQVARDGKLISMRDLPSDYLKVRTALGRGSSPRYLLPDAVLAYIRKHALYV